MKINLWFGPKNNSIEISYLINDFLMEKAEIHKYYMLRLQEHQQPVSFNVKGEHIVRREIRIPELQSLQGLLKLRRPSVTRDPRSDLASSARQDPLATAETEERVVRETPRRLYQNVPLSTPKFNRYDFFNFKKEKRRFLSPQDLDTNRKEVQPQSKAFKIKAAVQESKPIKKPGTTMGKQRPHENLNEIRKLIHKQWQNMESAHSTRRRHGRRNRSQRDSLQPFSVNDKELLKTKRLIRMQCEKRAPTAFQCQRNTSINPRGTADAANQSSNAGTCFTFSEEQPRHTSATVTASRHRTSSAEVTVVPKTQSLLERRKTNLQTPFAASACTNLSSQSHSRAMDKPMMTRRPQPLRNAMAGARGSVLSPISFDPNYHQKLMRNSMQVPASNDDRGGFLNFAQILAEKGLSSELDLSQTSPRAPKMSRQFHAEDRSRRQARPSSMLQSIISMTKQSEAALQMESKLPRPSKKGDVPEVQQSLVGNLIPLQTVAPNGKKIFEIACPTTVAGRKQSLVKSLNLSKLEKKVEHMDGLARTSKISVNDIIGDRSFASEVFDPTIRGSFTTQRMASAGEELRSDLMKTEPKDKQEVRLVESKGLQFPRDDDRVSRIVSRPTKEPAGVSEVSKEAIQILDGNEQPGSIKRKIEKDMSPRALIEDESLVFKKKPAQPLSFSEAANALKANQEEAKNKKLVLSDGSICELQELYKVLKHFAKERKQIQRRQTQSIHDALKQMALETLAAQAARDSEAEENEVEDEANAEDQVRRCTIAIKKRKEQIKTETAEEANRIIRQLSGKRIKISLQNAKEETREFLNDVLKDAAGECSRAPIDARPGKRDNFEDGGAELRHVQPLQEEADTRLGRVRKLLRPAFSRLVAIQMKIDQNSASALFQPHHLKRQMTAAAGGTKLLEKKAAGTGAAELPAVMAEALQSIFMATKKKKKKSSQKGGENDRTAQHRDIGAKYRALAKDLFRNDHLRRIVDKKPTYKDYLRVLQSDHKKRKDPDHTDLDKTFGTFVGDRTFYGQLKKPHLALADEHNEEKSGIVHYCDAFRKQGVNQAIDPSLIRIKDRVLFLRGRVMPLENCKALMMFLSETTAKENKIKEIVIDSCEITDEGIAQILQGAANQVETARRGGKPKKQHLHSFVATNCCFGPRSLQKLMDMNEDLLELKLSSIKSTAGFGQTFLTDMLYDFSNGCPYLFKLSLTRINLNNENIIQSLQHFLSTRQYLQLLDLSRASLAPNQLNSIVESLLEMTDSIRDLNLSYNNLEFREEGSGAHEDSQSFVENLITLIHEATIMAHLNLSGMGFDAASMWKICHAIPQTGHVNAVHLSDNGIALDREYFKATLDQFAIDKSAIPWQRRGCLLGGTDDSGLGLEDDELKLKRPPGAEASDAAKDRPLKSPEEFQKRLNCYFFNKDLQNQDGTQTTGKLSERKQSIETSQRDHYSSRVVKCHQLCEVREGRALNHSKHRDGLGRSMTSGHDCFVVSRVLNHPELIFKDKRGGQGPRHSQSGPAGGKRGGKYFAKGAASEWNLSCNNECFICDRHRYIMIFYERGILSANDNLVEVLDPDILDELKQQFEEDKDNKTKTPLICGTLIGRQREQGVFENKSKLLRTPLFALLSVLDCYNFIGDPKQADLIKDRIVHYLRSDLDEVMKLEKIKQSLQGWRQIITDIAHNNEQTDTLVVNFPDFSFKKLQRQDWYTFAGFYPPGYHQILIYDPLLERAFVKDIVVGVNCRSFVYPEYPQKKKVKIQKIVPDMWEKWNIDTEQDLNNIFTHETESEEFDPHKILRRYGDEEIDNCQQILRANMRHLMILQRELLSNSPTKYPQISWEATSAFVEYVQTGNPALSNYKKVQRSQVELCFIGATRTDDTKGLKSAMQRSELLDFLLRLSMQFVKANFDSREISDHLKLFIDSYVRRITDESVIERHRRVIRGSSVLNEFLFDNHEGLHDLFREAKKNKGVYLSNKFTLDVAHNFFDPLKGRVAGDFGTLLLNGKVVEDCFVFSQMSIWNEHEDGEEYLHLHFVEFQEMVCRVAFIAINSSESIERKVYLLLELIYSLRYEQEIWSPQDQPLYPLRYPKPPGETSDSDD